MSDASAKIKDSELKFTSAKAMIEKQYAQRPKISLQEILVQVKVNLDYYNRKIYRNRKSHFFVRELY